MNKPDEDWQGIYEPLPAQRSFRLLRLHRFQHERVCELRTFLIDQSPAYSALSYTWGPPLNTRECEDDYSLNSLEIVTIITAKGEKQLPIMRNLYEALCHLVESEALENLWVDAICINQSDDREKSIQVPLMGAIYSGSEGVLVWLGKDESNVEDFKWFHDVLYPALGQYGEEHGIQALLEPTWNHLSIRNRLGLDIESRWIGYSKFFQERRWFHRAWIVQEIALAPKISVIYGRSRISWADMANFAGLIRMNNLGLNMQNIRPQDPMRPPPNGCSILDSFRGLTMRGGPKDDSEPVYKKFLEDTAGSCEASARWYTFFILSCHLIVRPYEATIPHDKIYALLGILNHVSPSGSDFPIYPKYELPVEEVYKETTFYFIQQLPQLTILSCVEDKSLRKLPNLPSWVPDFTVANSLVTNLLFLPPCNWNASGAGTAQSYRRQLSGTTLELVGARFDSVEGITMAYQPGSGIEGVIQVAHFLEDIFNLCRETNAFEPYGQAKIESLSRTLVSRRFGPTVPLPDDIEPNSELRESHNMSFPPSETAIVFRSYVLILLASCSLLDVSEPAFRTCLEALTGFAENDTRSSDILFREPEVLEIAEALVISEEARSAEVNERVRRYYLQHGQYESKVSMALSGQRVYRTSEGYVGVGPISVQPGDQVWMICDARVPFVLRPSATMKGKYILIGETYLHGCMLGEMMTANLKKQLGPVYLV